MLEEEMEMLSSSNKNTLNSNFGEKTLEYKNHLYTYALLITGDERKAEKVLMKAYAEAYSFYNFLSEETDIKLWLTRILMNICRNFQQADNKNVGDQKIINTNLLVNINTKVLEREPSFKITQSLINKIPLLPFALKETLILLEILKFPYDIAADLIDIPEGTIRKRIFEARKFLLLKLLPDISKTLLDNSTNLGYEDKKLIIALVDSNIPQNQNSKKHDNFQPEIESQKFMKSFLDEHLKLQRPRDVFYSRIIKKFAPNHKDKINIKGVGEKRRFVIASTIAMFILIAILILTSKPPSLSQKEMAAEQIGDDNILIQLQTNHSLFTKGKFIKDTTSGDEEYLRNYLKSLGFENRPVFLKFKSWKIVGSIITVFKKEKLANYFYKNAAGDILYIYQIPFYLVEEKNIVKLSKNLLELLNSNNCFSIRKEETIYILKKSSRNIFGFAFNKQNRELIDEICMK